MTSRSLVKDTLEFKNTNNRAPRDLWFLDWAKYHYPNELSAITEAYPNDIDYPNTIYSQCSPVEKGQATEIGAYTDAWGCNFTNVQRGVIGQVKTPIVTGEDWEDVGKITIPEDWLSFEISQVNEECRKSEKFLICSCCPRPFEQLQFIRGTANLYMDLIDPPKKFLEFLEVMHDFYCRLLRKWAQTDVNALRFMDDWGSQRSLLISPTLWKKYFAPMYQDYIEIAKTAGKKTFMHSDGHIIDIIPELIDLGLDAINTQLFCMDFDKLKEYRGKITFWGEVCRQRILPYGTLQDVETAVHKIHETLWDNGGCIAQCEFGPGAKPENVEAVFRTWDSLTAKG